jgi:CO/xanthine dehydrogenase Mo-binding subunit
MKTAHSKSAVLPLNWGRDLSPSCVWLLPKKWQLLLNQVRVLVMDTDLTPNGGPTTASRQTFVTGNASRYAAKTLRDEITATMAEKYDVKPRADSF